MRIFVVLLLLAAAAYAAHHFGYIRFGDRGASDAERGTGAEGREAPRLLNLEGPGAGPAAGQAALPLTVVDNLAKAEKRWQGLVEAGLDPLTSSEVIELSRSFSAALRAAYGKPALAQLRERLLKTYLLPIGETVFLSRKPILDEKTGLIKVHEVQPGSSLSKISDDYGLPYTYLNILRGRQDIEDGQLRPGDRLKVVDLKSYGTGLFLHIDKSDFTMDLFVADCFVKRYPIGIGAEATETPLGTTFVDAREQGADWYQPDTGEAIPISDSRHIIGPYWIRLNDGELGRRGIGIHGFTGKGAAVGVKASNGCIRMRNEDVKELFAMVPNVSMGSGGFSSRGPKTIVEIVE